MTHLYQKLSNEAKKQPSFIWQENLVSPCKELVVGWNAKRPDQGQYHLSISLKVDTWSPWFPYAVWETEKQRSFEFHLDPIHLYQDTITIAGNTGATGWKVKVEGKNGANLQGFHTIYATFPSSSEKKTISHHSFIGLEVPRISQVQISDPRHMRLCSPTSTTAVVRFLNNCSLITPLEFADKVWDSHFDIYGHWVFAAAQAYAELGEEWETRVMYLNDFDGLYQFLEAGYPVVVSVKGFLPGSIHSYDQGHLLVVRGYDPETNKILCMDPAFPADSQTYVSYPLDEFLSCWKQRKNIAYTFKGLCRHRINVAIS